MKPASLLVLALTLSLSIAPEALAAGPDDGQNKAAAAGPPAPRDPIEHAATELRDFGFCYGIFQTMAGMLFVASVVVMLFAPKAPKGTIEASGPRTMLIGAIVITGLINLVCMNVWSQDPANWLVQRQVLADDPVLRAAANEQLLGGRNGGLRFGGTIGLLLGSIAAGVTLYFGFTGPGAYARWKARTDAEAAAAANPTPATPS